MQGRPLSRAARQRQLPSTKQAAAGMSLAADNAWDHLMCAESLHRDGRFGAASAHLIYAVEEAAKARVLHKWPALVKLLGPRDLHRLLYSHEMRQAIAGVDSMPHALRTALALWRIDH